MFYFWRPRKLRRLLFLLDTPVHRIVAPFSKKGLTKGLNFGQPDVFHRE